MQCASEPAQAGLCPAGPTGGPGNVAAAWPAYMVDTFQRSVLFLELPRRRGNQEIAIELQPTATVLRYKYDVRLDGKSLKRPMNYILSRSVPAAGVTTDPLKRPVVVVDPRAGQGPGIGGFKLTCNELKSHDGVTFDTRNITSPIIVFTSMGDNIRPPQQTLGPDDMITRIDKAGTAPSFGVRGPTLPHLKTAE